MNDFNLLKTGLVAAMLIAPALSAQSDSGVLAGTDTSQEVAGEQGLVVYEIKSQGHVEATVVYRGEGKLIDYYDQNKADQSLFSDGELSSSPPLRVWRLSR